SLLTRVRLARSLLRDVESLVLLTAMLALVPRTAKAEPTSTGDTPLALAVARAPVAPVLCARFLLDSIRGRVTTDSGGAIVGADVIVTMAPTTEVIRVLSDSSGRYAF